MGRFCSKEVKLPRLNLLFSFAYVNQVDDMLSALLETTNVLIDSGAFTNHQAGLKGKPATATLPSYVEFCRKIDTRAWNYIALDVIGKKEKTRANLQAMLDAGLKPMPVFVYGEDYDRVGSLCEINGGRVWVATQRGEGTTVYLMLPTASS